MIETVIETAELKNNKIIINGETHNAIVGKHCVYIPGLEMKIINSHNGRIEPIRDWEKGKNKKEIENGTFNSNVNGFDFESRCSIISEYKIMKILSEKSIVPKIGKPFYIKNFISGFPFGNKNCDCTGRYGYFMKDANTSPKQPEIDFIHTIKNINKINIPSKYTIGDMLKSDNVINGYLIDIRRTIWDMVSLTYTDGWFKKEWTKLFKYTEPKAKLKKNIQDLSQFPHKRRKQNYQTYFMDEKWENGSRNTLERFEKMGIEKNLLGKSVVDIGCQLGSVAMECWNRGARLISGYDFENDYIKCARDLARYNGMTINFLELDLMKENPDVNGKIDIVFFLSLYKHIGDKMFSVLKSFKWETCYIESNNCPGHFEAIQAKRIETGIKKAGWKFERLGVTEDRSPRCLWKLTG